MTTATLFDCSVGKVSTSVLDIKEFVPGRPWGSQLSEGDATESVAATSSGSDSTQGLGMRCSSLADMEKLVVSNTSRLSTSEWSLDGSASGSGSAGGSKGIVDPAGSLPALWTPLDTSGGTPVPSSNGTNTIYVFLVCKINYKSGLFVCNFVHLDPF